MGEGWPFGKMQKNFNNLKEKILCGALLQRIFGIAGVKVTDSF